MQETLHDHHTSLSIGDRPLCNLRFADDIDLMSCRDGDLRDLINRLVERARFYGMEVSTGKSQIMTNSTNNISAYISIVDQNLEKMTSFKYLEVTGLPKQ